MSTDKIELVVDLTIALKMSMRTKIVSGSGMKDNIRGLSRPKKIGNFKERQC